MRYTLPLLTICSLVLFGCLRHDAQASVIIQRPLFIGLDRGLVGYWPFDGKYMSNSRALDASANHDDGTLTNGAVLAAGAIGQGVQFDGANDYVKIPDATAYAGLLDMPGDGARAWSLWVYPTSFHDGQTVWYLGGATGAGQQSVSIRVETTTDTERGPVTQGVSFEINSGDCSGKFQLHSTNNALRLNAWQHIAVTFDYDLSPQSRAGHIFVNGADVTDSSDVGRSDACQADGVQAGISNPDPGSAFKGKIDEVRYYGRVLSPDEIKRLYRMGTPKTNSTLAGPTNGLVGWWTFDGRDTNIKNVSAGSVSGTMGETNILGITDSGNGDLLLAQQATLAQDGTLQSLSFYVETAAGDLRLGVYDDDGPSGGPGTKLAETNGFTPVSGWNTANVIAPVSLLAGTYWLAYNPSSSSLTFKRDGTGSFRLYSYPYAALPATYSTTPSSGTDHWSFYATLTAGPGSTLYTLDRSGQGHTGKYFNATSTTQLPGRISQGLTFDGADDYVSVGNVSGSVQTISFWIQANNTSKKIIGLNGTASIEVSGGTITANNFTSPAIYVDGAVTSTIDTKWHHVAIVTNTAINASEVDIGRISTGYFLGTLDDVRMYSRALTADEVKRLYKIGGTVKLNTTLEGPQNGLVGWWTFDGKNMAGVHAYDASGNGNRGTLNSTTVTDTFSSNASTTYSVPGGVSSVTVETWGAGGEGGAGLSGSDGGGGGGGGGYAKKVLNVNPGQVLNLSIGKGGAGATDKRGQSGGDTTVESAGTIVLEACGGTGGGASADNGNAGGLAGAGGTTACSTGDVEFAGGDGGPGENGSDGDGAGGGEGACDDGNGATGGSPGANGGAGGTGGCSGGGGGDGGAGGNNGGGGSIGTSVGGGGGGSGEGTSLSGGDGADGQIKLTYISPDPERVAGKIGQALKFDGVDDLVNMGNPSSLQITGSLTLAGWANLSYLSSSSNGQIVTKNAVSPNRGWRLNFCQICTVANVWDFGISPDGTDSVGIEGSTPATTGQWVHVAGVYDADAQTVKLYINGVSEGTTFGTIPSSQFNNSNNVAIGGMTNGSNYFPGLLDDVRIYNRALTKDEIKRLYNAGR